MQLYIRAMDLKLSRLVSQVPGSINVLEDIKQRPGYSEVKEYLDRLPGDKLAGSRRVDFKGFYPSRLADVMLLDELNDWVDYPSETCGLCGLVSKSAYLRLVHQLRAVYGDVLIPFNENMDDYHAESLRGECHLNPKRIAFVKETIDFLKKSIAANQYGDDVDVSAVVTKMS